MTAPNAAGGAPVRLRFVGALTSMSDDDRRALLDRGTSADAGVRTATAAIIDRVRREGDIALLELARSFDNAQLTSIELPRQEWLRASDRIAPALRRSMSRAAENIARVHRALVPTSIETEPEPGILIGRRPDPLGRVGVYAPGGRAAYPSSVLMGVIPARVAGVGEVILCSPPTATGQPSDVVLAAAALAGVDRVFSIGGAGAIAAMAYGTQSVPRVDRIVGPGNAYVAEAKLQVSGAVAIDSPAGPSELVVIADATSRGLIVARELLAQAEHDPRASVVAIVVGADVASSVEARLGDLLASQPRRAIVEEALATRGGILVAETLDHAIEFANAYAPEHLLLANADADKFLTGVRNAGTVFVGESASVSFGDYMTGANHVLPTGGLARCYSGLSVLDFVRWTTYQQVNRRAAQSLAPDVSVFADAESLPGHAAAAREWLVNTSESEDGDVEFTL